MLTTLMKHEMRYHLKNFGILYIVYLCSTLVLRILLTVDNHMSGSRQQGYLNALIVLLLCLIIIFSFGFWVILLFDTSRRYKKSHFSDEGYLTNTLPVAAWQHIAAKLIVSVAAMLLIFLVISAGSLILSGVENDTFSEITKISIIDFTEVAEWFVDDSGKGFAIILFIISLYASMVLFTFLCSTVAGCIRSKNLGQLAEIGLFIIMVNVVSFFVASVTYHANNFSETTIFILLSIGFIVIGAIEFALTELLLRKCLNI